MIAERLYEFIISKKKILLSTLSLSVLLPSLLSLTNTKLAVSKPTKMPLPKLVAFDLDGTIWTPDMYQLWGGGAPFSMAKNGRDLLDRSGRTVRLLGISDKILHELRTNPEMTHIKVRKY